MITDIVTGTELFSDLEPIVGEHGTASVAYSAWASELGLSSTDTLAGLVITDDSAGEIDLGFSPTIGGADTKIMQSSEGSIGFFVNPTPASVVSRPITKILPEQVNVSRAYTSRQLNPALIVNCKHPSVDSRSAEGRWQKTADTAIIYIVWSAYGNQQSNRVECAFRISQGSLEIVCTSNPNAGGYLQVFMMDSTTTSAQALAGNGNMAVALGASQTHHYRSIGLKSISGTVIGANGVPAAATVRAYERSTGKFVGAAISDAVTGAYTITTSVDEHYVICLDDSDAMLNALIFDKVISVG